MAKGLLPVADAQTALLDRVSALPAEEVPTAQALDRVLARDLEALWDLPGRDVSIMDGWAVRAADLAPSIQTLSIELMPVAESAAGHPSGVRLGPGQAVRISTGAIVPEGADVVVPIEDTRLVDGRVRVDLDAYGAVTPGRFVRGRGSDVAQGERVLSAGTRLRPGALAAAVSCGHPSVHVHARPRVAILSTGDELVPVGSTPALGQVVSANGLMLAALVHEAGGTPIELGDVIDEEAPLAGALQEGLRADVLITSGGISVGEHDLVHGALERLGARTVFRGVALQPGKPTTVLETEGCVVFALPGNPASTLVAFELFVRPVLRKMAGVRGDTRRPFVQVHLLAPVPGNARREHYVRARRSAQGATPLRSQLSGNLRSIADFELLLRVPAGTSELPAGTTCEALDVTGDG